MPGRHTLAFIFGLTLAAGGARAATLFADGEARAAIVCAPDAPDLLRFAAAQLAEHLELVTGVAWPVADHPDAVPAGQIPILLGDSAWSRARGFDPATVGPDGFQWRVADEYVVIAGRDYAGPPLAGIIHPQRLQEVWNPDLKLGAFGEAGTLNGVCRFLEAYAGVRWYMTGDLGRVAPPRERLDIPNQVTARAPDFEYRYPWFCNFPDAPEDAVWYRRVGFGAPAPVTITHNYSTMLRYKDQHPEYFALIGGRRDFTNLSVVGGGGNLCLSNPDVLERWIEIICDFFDAHPNHTLYPVCPMDGMVKICECPDCQAQLSPHLGHNGMFSNYVWGFSDKVARGVAARHPGKFVGTFAYERYHAPPDAPAELSPNLAVMICYSRQAFRDPEVKARTRGLIAAWRERTPTLYFWTYPIFDYWLPWRGFPVFYPSLLAEDFRANRDLAAKGEFLESEFAMPNDPDVKGQYIAYPALSHPNTYLRAKLLWDADADVPALLDEYYRLFHGPAEDAMRRFWTLAEQLYLARAEDHPVKQYRPEDIQALFALLDDADAAAPAGSVYARRLALLRGEMEPFARRLVRLAETRRPLAVPLTEEVFGPDRDLLASAWKRGARYKFVGKDGGPVDFATFAVVLADAEGLGVTFVNFEPAMDRLVTRTKERDTGAVWEDDSVEVFVCREDGSGGVQYIVTAAGNILDARWDAPGSPLDNAWNGLAEVRTWKGDDRWTAQLKIPWAELGATPATAGTLKANLYRNRAAGGDGVRHSCFTPSMAYQHRVPDFFGAVVLEPAP